MRWCIIVSDPVHVLSHTFAYIILYEYSGLFCQSRENIWMKFRHRYFILSDKPSSRCTLLVHTPGYMQKCSFSTLQHLTRCQGSRLNTIAFFIRILNRSRISTKCPETDWIKYPNIKNTSNACYNQKTWSPPHCPAQQTSPELPFTPAMITSVYPCAFFLKHYLKERNLD